MTGTTEVVSTQQTWHSGVRELWRKLYSDKLAFASFLFIVVIIICAVFAEQLAPHDPTEQNLLERLRPPGTSGHVLGTDGLGRDALSRMMEGTRFSILIGGASTLLAMGIGVPLGFLAGYYSGKVDAIISRLVDMKMAFSSLLILLLVVVMIGPGPGPLILVFGISTWPVHTRIVRAGVANIRQQEFVQAAMATGASNARIILRHLAPHLIPVIIVMGTLEIARLMVGEASVSFLGFGVQPPDISWGLMVAQGRSYMQDAWWLVVFPGLAIFVTILSINFLGQWMRGISNPHQRQLIGKPESEHLAE